MRFVPALALQSESAVGESYRLISVDDALDVVLTMARPLPQESVPILGTLGRVLAEDIHADMDIPPLSNSAMDGFALRAGDTASASAERPVGLQVIEDLAAGYTTEQQVTPGTAIRIMTGAPIPAGADTVVPFEQASVQGDQVILSSPLTAGKNIRLAGEDVRRGQLVLERGSVIRAQEVGMLASLGRSTARCMRQPRVGILATGDEVIEIDAPWRPGKIRNANSHANAAQVLKYGGVPVLLGIARDTTTEVAARLREGLGQGLDLLLTSGGISVGDFDVVKEVLAAEGEISFWQVAMRPGKPLAFGQIGGIPFVGLPGNPVSAMVSFELFVRPAILKMLGYSSWQAPTVEATLEEDIQKRAGFRYYLRVALEQREGECLARLTGEQGSGIMLSMVKAQGLAVLPEERTVLHRGERVTVMLLT